MITETLVAHAIQTCAVAIVGITVFFKVLPMFRLDCFRQSMFSVRDELFDYAAAGNIAFNDPAYILLRLQMNGMIRFGHQLTLFRAMVSTAIKKVSGDTRTLTWNEAWEKSLAGIENDEVRCRMVAFHDRSTFIAAKHIITGSFVLWIAMAGVAFFIATRGAAHGVKQSLKAASKTVLSGPIDHRFIEEDAVGAMV